MPSIHFTENEVRDYLRIDDDIDNTLSIVLLDSAIKAIEEYCRRSLDPATKTIWLDDFQNVGKVDPVTMKVINYIEIQDRPLTNVTGISYFSSENVETGIVSENYYTLLDRYIPAVAFTNSFTVPTDLRSLNAVKIEIEVGYAEDELPASLRSAVLEYTGFLYEHRGEDENMGSYNTLKMSPQVKKLLSPYRIYLPFG